MKKIMAAKGAQFCNEQKMKGSKQIVETLTIMVQHQFREKEIQ